MDNVDDFGSLRCAVTVVTATALGTSKQLGTTKLGTAAASRKTIGSRPTTTTISTTSLRC